MFKAAINEQMEKWKINNPNQLSKLAGIDYRTASKAVNTDNYMSPRSIAKIAKVFGFKGWVDFRLYAISKYNLETRIKKAAL